MKVDVQKLPSVLLADNNPWKKNKFGEKEPVVDDSGCYTYLVKIFASNGRKMEELEVAVKAKENPVAGLDPMTPLAFKGLTVSFGVYNGKKYWVLNADSVARF